MADNEVSFLVKLKDEFNSGINKVIKGFTGLDSATAKSNVSTTALGVAFGNLAAKAVGAGLNGIKQLGAFLVDCVYSLAEAERSTNALSASLQNMGINSSYVLQDLTAYADQLQNISGISGDVFQDGMRLLTSFGLFGDELKRATASAYNLSLGLNIDLKSAFQMVARGAEMGGAAFTRAGIAVDTTKSKSEQFADALDKIDAKFGQLAGANANNLITKTGVLKKTWGDFKEAVGSAVGGGTGIVDVLIWGVERLKDGLRLIQNYYARLFEEVIIGTKQFKLMYDGVIAGAAAAKTAVLELGNTMKLVSDDAVQEAQKELAAKKSQMDMTAQQINQLKEQRTALFDLSDARVQASEAEKAEAQSQIEQAKANYEAQKQAEEARKQAAKEAEVRMKRLNDFAVNARKDRYNKIAEIIKEENRTEQAAVIFRQQQEYEVQLSAIEARLALLDNSNALELEKINELNEEKKIIREEFDAYNTELDALQREEKIAATNADIERARQAAELELQFSNNKYTAIKSGLTNLATFQNAKTKELAAVGKAAAIANATISTYEAAAKALTAAPPPWNLVLAATSTAAGLANVTQIMGVKLAVGTPYVPEDMPATVHQGEIIIPRTFSEGLRSGDLVMSATEDLGAGGGDIVNSGNINVNFNGDVLSDNPESISRKLAEVLSQQIAGGQIAPLPTGERM